MFRSLDYHDATPAFHFYGTLDVLIRENYRLKRAKGRQIRNSVVEKFFPSPIPKTEANTIITTETTEQTKRKCSSFKRLITQSEHLFPLSPWNCSKFLKNPSKWPHLSAGVCRISHYWFQHSMIQFTQRVRPSFLQNLFCATFNLSYSHICAPRSTPIEGSSDDINLRFQAS